MTASLRAISSAQHRQSVPRTLVVHARGDRPLQLHRGDVVRVYLTLFFKPSMIELAYNGSYVPSKGVKMTEAYASTLNIRSTFAAVC